MLRALTGIAFASATVLACGDDAAPAQAPAWTPDPSSIVETPVPIEESLPVPGDEERHLKVVEGILPSPAATSAILDLEPGVWALLGVGFGQELEHLDFTDSGITAGGTALFVPALEPAAGATPEGMYLSPADYHRRPTPTAGATPYGMYLSLVFHDTPEQADRTYQHLRGELGDRILSGDEKETIADAVSSDNCCIIVIRQGTVTAMVVMLEDRDVGAGLREFARMLALGIDEFVRTQSP
jgi:hypothetical protein